MIRRMAPYIYDLSVAETAEVGSAAGEVRRVADGAGEAGLIDAAQLYGGYLPEGLLNALSDFRRFGNERGVLAISNLPLPASLPPTPSEPESVARDCSPSVAALSLVMSRLGDPIAYAEEKGGALVHDVCPVPGEEERQENSGATYLKLHTENAFHPARPDFVGLLCLRADHEQVAATITASIREAYRLLDPADIEILREARFRTRPTSSFARSGQQRTYLPPHPVITGPPNLPSLCVDFDDTQPTDVAAAHALTSLQDALLQVQKESVLRAGQMAIIDNSAVVHGRTAFAPRYDGRDRWLQRLFSVASIRAVLDHIEDDGAYRCKPLAS